MATATLSKPESSDNFDNFNPKVDAYINKAKPFAQPILEHLRELVHKACPTVEETIKWSRPFFEYKGAILGNMSAFKEHCSFGFWGEEIGAVLREAKAVQDGAMGSLGRITTVKDLPIRQANARLDPPGHSLHRQRQLHQPDRGKAQGRQSSKGRDRKRPQSSRRPSRKTRKPQPASPH